MKVEMDVTTFKDEKGLHIYLTKYGRNMSDFIISNEQLSGILWKPAQGDDNLPIYDREVIALQRMASESLKVVFAHRPNPEGYVVVDGEKLYAKTYDDGGWNLPDIEYWLDVELPKEIEQC